MIVSKATGGENYKLQCLSTFLSNELTAKQKGGGGGGGGKKRKEKESDIIIIDAKFFFLFFFFFFLSLTVVSGLHMFFGHNGT